MKTTYENIDVLEKELDRREIISIEITDDLVRDLNDNIIVPYFGKDQLNYGRKINSHQEQYNYLRRDLLKIKYRKNNNSAKGIKEGFVYAISNPAWKDYIKIGSAIDVYDRLNVYQTSSPLRDYELVDYFFSYDRLKDEKELHNRYQRLNEWCKVSKEDILDLFSTKKLKTKIYMDRTDQARYCLDQLKVQNHVIDSENNIRAIMTYIRSGFSFLFPKIENTRPKRIWLINQLNPNRMWNKCFKNNIGNIIKFSYLVNVDNYIIQAFVNQENKKIISVEVHVKEKI